MIIEQELREQIRLALSGSISLNDLYVWLMDRSWNMHKDSAQSAVELASEVEALFVERSNGHLDDAAMKARLELLPNELVLEVNIGEGPRIAFVPSHGPAIRKQSGRPLAPKMQPLPVWVH